MLKPSLQLRIGQTLTMTPQLQQAIRLLQLPVMDLQTKIQEALESNVMLENVEEYVEVKRERDQKTDAEANKEAAEEPRLEDAYRESRVTASAERDYNSSQPPISQDIEDMSGQTLQD
ncbi:MAG: RNA polymerase factor sigma-54, partial [Gammaproteobacteria bacterium]|nr:RNA polymerase factor sigma-54 [Gammaproteobacteria bacterium]